MSDLERLREAVRELGRAIWADRVSFFLWMGLIWLGALAVILFGWAR